KNGFDALVDLPAASFDIELRLCTNRQAFDGFRKVTLVRPADERVLHTEGTDDFGRAGDQRHNAHRSVPRDATRLKSQWFRIGARPESTRSTMAWRAGIQPISPLPRSICSHSPRSKRSRASVPEFIGNS